MEHEVQFGVNSIPSLYMVCDDDLPFVPILSNLTVYPPPPSLSLVVTVVVHRPIWMSRFTFTYGTHTARYAI